jgi:hypothetical protein
MGKGQSKKTLKSWWSLDGAGLGKYLT